jgi:hypothetical protein
MRIASLLLAPFALLACAAPSSDVPSDEADFRASFGNARWTPIVSCDDGAMTVEVNTNERRELRVVVHDQGIARHVSQGQYDSTYKSNRCGGGFAANPCVADNGDLALAGTTSDGVFSARAFRWLRGTAQLNTGTRSVDFTAWRDGTGVRLEKMSDSEERMTCDTSGSGFCSPVETVPAPKEVYADWRFRSCVDL